MGGRRLSRLNRPWARLAGPRRPCTHPPPRRYATALAGSAVGSRRCAPKKHTMGGLLCAPGQRVLVDVAACLQRAVRPQGKHVQVVHLQGAMGSETSTYNVNWFLFAQRANTCRSSTCRPAAGQRSSYMYALAAWRAGRLGPEAGQGASQGRPAPPMWQRQPPWAASGQASPPCCSSGPSTSRIGGRDARIATV